MPVELHAASAFSFLRASSSPEDLVARAAELGYSAVALVDRDGVSGAPRFFKAARAAGLEDLAAFAEGLVALPGFETLGSPPDSDRLARLLEIFGPRRLAVDVQ